MKTIVDIAKIVAYEAHDGQFRRDGHTKYIVHPCAVASKVTELGGDAIAIAAAWLHDVLEDTDRTVYDLRSYGVLEEVIEVVRLLTKKSETVTQEELQEIVSNERARLVKICDIIHNLSDSPTRSQIFKYAKRLNFLTNEYGKPLTIFGIGEYI